MMPAQKQEGLDKTMAKIKAKRGLSVEIAKACGVQRAAVYQWRKVPPHHVQTVAQITGWSPQSIRSDIFGKRK